MKKNLLLIVILLSQNIFAQKIITEGTLIYNITITTTKGEKQLSSALNGAVLTLYLTSNKSRTEMQSSLGTETTVFDNKENKGFILKEYSGQKLMITTSFDNWTQKNQVTNTLNFSIDNNTFAIAGYACKKATATTTTDGKVYTVYFDATSSILNKSYNNAFPQLAGLPVQYELQSGNLIFKYTLTKSNANIIVANKFEAPKTGFRIMTYEENQQLKKGE